LTIVFFDIKKKKKIRAYEINRDIAALLFVKRQESINGHREIYLELKFNTRVTHTCRRRVSFHYHDIFHKASRIHFPRAFVVKKYKKNRQCILTSRLYIFAWTESRGVFPRATLISMEQFYLVRRNVRSIISFRSSHVLLTRSQLYWQSNH